jgi:hypothetical protein
VLHDFGLLFLALAGGLVALWWRSSVEARDRANVAAQRACQRENVQFLDGTVAFQRVAPARDAEGRFALRRTYVFDYTDDGLTRHQGFVVLHGREVELVGLGPTLVPGASP